jgi:hypothetical protein
MQIPKVDRKSVEEFSRIWTYKGVALCLNDAHVQFAADFANVVLRSFVQQIASQKPAPRITEE